MAQDLEQRTRTRAHAIWEREGRPEGRADDHWELASEELAIEDNIGQTLRPNPSHGPDDTAEHTEPVEPAFTMDQQADMPGLEDQGKAFHVPGATDPDEPATRKR